MLGEDRPKVGQMFGKCRPMLARSRPNNVDCVRLNAYPGFAFDEKYSPGRQDFNSVLGALNLGWQCKRVRLKGFGLMAPQCSSWLQFLDQTNHGRTKDNIFGKELEPDVAEGNITASLIGFLIEFLTYRGVYVLVEQPTDSLQPLHPAMACAYSTVGASRYHTWLGAFGCASPKPTQFHTTFPESAMVEYLVRSKPKETKQKSTHVDRNGNINGNQCITETEAYTDELGQCFALALKSVQ